MSVWVGGWVNGRVSESRKGVLSYDVTLGIGTNLASGLPPFPGRTINEMLTWLTFISDAMYGMVHDRISTYTLNCHLFFLTHQDDAIWWQHQAKYQVLLSS